MKTEPKNRSRRMLVRGLLAVAYVAVMGVAFTLGKGHTILLDNKESEDGTLQAVEEMTVSVNGGEPIDFMAGDRDMVKVRAQRHTVVIEMQGKRIEKQITVPLMEDMVLLSIPRLLAGQEPAVVPFVPMQEPPSEPEPAPTSDPASPEADPGEVPAVPSL